MRCGAPNLVRFEVAALTPALKSQSQKGIAEYVRFLHEYPEILQPSGAVNDMMLAMLFGVALSCVRNPKPRISEAAGSLSF